MLNYIKHVRNIIFVVENKKNLNRNLIFLNVIILTGVSKIGPSERFELLSDKNITSTNPIPTNILSNTTLNNPIALKINAPNMTKFHAPSSFRQNMSTQQNSSTPQQNSTTPQQNSTISQQNSSNVQHNSTTFKQNSTTPQQNSSNFQKNSYTSNNTSNTANLVQNSTTSVQNSTYLVQNIIGKIDIGVKTAGGVKNIMVTSPFQYSNFLRLDVLKSETFLPQFNYDV